MKQYLMLIVLNTKTLAKPEFVELEKNDYFFATMIDQLFIISAIFAQKRI